MSIVQQWHDKIIEYENSKKELQYEKIIELIKARINTNAKEVAYDIPIYDDVRKRLNDEGFKIETKTLTNGDPGYIITISEDYLDEVNSSENKLLKMIE